jgi:hypothetical protein
MPRGLLACRAMPKIWATKTQAPGLPGARPDAFCDAEADLPAPGRDALPHRRRHFPGRRSGDSGSRMGHYDGDERSVTLPGGRPAIHRPASSRRDRSVAAGRYPGRHAAAPAGPAWPPTSRPAGFPVVADRRVAATHADTTAHAAPRDATFMAMVATALAISLTWGVQKPVGRLAVGRLGSSSGQSVSLGLGRQKALVGHRG